MDQEAWNQIYADLEKDVAALAKRGASVSDIDVIIGIDRARFAMERGDSDEAIARIQDLRRQLRGGDDAPTRGSPAPASPVLDRLDALEDNLHATTRLGSARLEIVGEDEEAPTRAASQNTKVNKSIKYEDIKDELQKLWDTCKVRPDKQEAARREADRVVANRKVYEEISAKTQVPWWFIGLIHGMECSFSLSKHLHNGDSLKARTWQVPAGRPKDGSPVFTFQESAVDALQVDGFAGKTDWPLPMVLFRLERYNGFGYRKKFGFASPYLWSYTNHFTSGKYVKDGVFDANATSKQCGTSAMLRDLLDRGIVTFDEKKPDAAVATAQPPVAVPSSPAPAPAPVATPAPAAAPVPASAPSTVVQPASAPAPATPQAPAPVVPTAPAAPAPAAVPAAAPAPAQPQVVAPASAPAPVGIAPVPAPSAPAPAAAAAAPAAPPASSPPMAAVLPKPEDAAATNASSSGVSTAVAAALAELAKRGR